MPNPGKNMSRRSRRPANRFAARGFTLVELIVTVVVMAIIAAVAVPRFAELTNRSRLTAAGNEMVALLQTARAGAISGRASVNVCPTTDGATCSATLGSHWIAVMTKNGTTTVLRDSTFNTAVTIKASPALSGASNRFTFTPNGFSSVGAGANGAVRFCSPKVSGNNGIDVSTAVGRITTARRAATAACTAPGDS